MKIAHISIGDAGGGAARAAYRLHRSLVNAGVDSSMYVVHKNTEDELVTRMVPSRPLLHQIIEKIKSYLWNQKSRRWHTDNSNPHSYGYASAGLIDLINACDADIINLHWISDMLSVTDIGKLRKPLVWTFHDMWPFCGGEHYAPDGPEARFRLGYCASNRPAGERGPDLDRTAWEAKRQAWSQQRFMVVCPSKWLADCAAQSVLFADVPIRIIHNPLDTTCVWKQYPQNVARLALGLPTDGNFILMGAHDSLSDPRKGGDLLHEAMAHVAGHHSEPVELMVFGQNRPAHAADWPCPVHWLGRVHDDRILALAYSSADVMVVPSRQDNLPNTAVEAQACGTPVVAFAIGGLPDIVTHQETGWLAAPFDTTDLAAGIIWTLGRDSQQADIRSAVRRQAEAKFAEPVAAAQYAELYIQLLAGDMV